MGLAVVVLNWNAAADTLRCVKELIAWEVLQPTVWVVDNGSTDDSPNAIPELSPQVHLIRNSTNEGFAGGNNRGIAESLSAGHAFTLLLNNDAFLSEKDAARLLDSLRCNERIGFIGPLLYDADTQDTLLAAGGKNPVRHHHSHILELTPGTKVREVEYVPGTALLARSEVFRSVGSFDKEYFFSMEVADLCRRARQHGYISAVDTRARAYHATSRRPSLLRETLYAYYIVRNRFLYVRKFYSKSKPLFFGLWSAYSVALALKVLLGGKKAAARAVWMGLTDGLRGRFGGQNERLLGQNSINKRAA